MTPPATLRRSTNIALCRSLHEVTLYGSPFETPEDGNVYWVLWQAGEPLGFCSVRASIIPGCAFLSRAGVLPGARGNNYQRRMIRARVAWAREEGYASAISWAHATNVPSLRSLVREGFLPWTPPVALDDSDVVYVRLDL